MKKVPLFAWPQLGISFALFILCWMQTTLDVPPILPIIMATFGGVMLNEALAKPVFREMADCAQRAIDLAKAQEKVSDSQHKVIMAQTKQRISEAFPAEQETP